MADSLAELRDSYEDIMRVEGNSRTSDALQGAYNMTDSCSTFRLLNMRI